MELTTRDRVVGLLKTVGLNKVAAKVVYRLEGFKTANTVVLGAIDRSFDTYALTEYRETILNSACSKALACCMHRWSQTNWARPHAVHRLRQLPGTSAGAGTAYRDLL